MSSRKEKLLVVSGIGGLLLLTVLNRLYRASSRNDLSMFSIEAIKAGWPYWVGILLGVVGYIGYWIYSVRKDGSGP